MPRTTTNRTINRPAQLLRIETSIAILRQKLSTRAAELVSGSNAAAKIKRMVVKELLASYRQTVAQVRGQSKDGVFRDALRQQTEYLNGFEEAIASGELSDKQIIARAASYARSLKLVFHAAEQDHWVSMGYTQGKRNLDRRPHQSCSDCDLYASWGWVDIDKVVLPGEDCRCHGNCRCDVVWRR